jgi:hypothetical protein
VEGNRKRGRPKRIWMDDVKDWTGRKTGDLIRLAEERTMWCRIVNSAGSPPMAAWLRDMMMMMMMMMMMKSILMFIVCSTYPAIIASCQVHNVKFEICSALTS